MAPTVLLTSENLTKAYGQRKLFEGVSLTLHEGDHVGLVGPNGAGKSTLLKILAGIETPDTGTRAAGKNVRAGYVPQDPVFEPGKSPEQVLDETLVAHTAFDEQERFQRAALALGRAGFTDRSARTETLSGGWRKRLAISRELVLEPDILLLDEPTNHLDVAAILWLEGLLRSESRAFVVVSHDRYFLQNTARRMLELNPVFPGGLLAVDGNYADMLEARDELLRHQAAYQETLANLARREVAWLRRGAKARTSKSRARIQSAEKLQEELADVRGRSVVETAAIDFNASGRRTKRLWVGRELCKRFDSTPIVEGLDLILTPGTRLGIIGPNASGKTTLLKMIVGELPPDSGTITRADGLRVVYFEQHRETLDPSTSLRRALAPEGDGVVYCGRALHVASWARRFLFGAEQLDRPVSTLSGGERARVHLARLMLQPADLLVLDEPTNDLDIPTLDVLEESLLEFPGALVLVTHDRYLLDRVSTQVLALDGSGVSEKFADYAQWEASLRDAMPAKRKPKPKRAEPIAPGRAKSKRLGYLEQREWDAMEESVLAAEARAEEARARAEDPTIASDAVALEARLAELTEAQQEVDRLYARWAELEQKIQ